jgi:uncharacterized protein (TIGR03435 family)
MKWRWLLLALSSAAVVQANQSSAPAPVSGLAFEVASVKPNVTDGETGRTTFGVPARGAVTIRNATVRQLILRAYGIPSTMEDVRIAGGPEAVLSRRFDITAKPPDNAPAGQAAVMLKNLLADRFKLRAHMETRDGPIYAVTLAHAERLGPNLRRSTSDCASYADALRQAIKEGRVTAPGAPGAPFSCVPTFMRTGGLNIRGAGTIERLIASIQGFVDRRLVDRTQLTGNFEWEMVFAAFGRTLNGSAGAEPQIDVALQEQLGLKLVSETGPTEILVIDSVEMPTEN